ncbi:MAG TPA: M50 family metallopeptidase [Caulobacteraceae bacterium]|jgi:Zn-dependent protease|nr:M50 family metallopeptidase [Caulobacteraceae bacterium]
MTDDTAAGAGTDTGPWGSRDGSAPEPVTPAATVTADQPKRNGQGPSLIWNLVSTLLLAALLAAQAGWLWALAAIVGVFVHEYGHVIAINLLGCGPGRIRIVPFVGGAAYPRIGPPTEFKGVIIALAGPIFGLLASLPFFGLALWSHNGFWLKGAFVVAAINLVNLLPAPPLDGSKALGPALARLHPWVERGAVLLVGALAAAWALWTTRYIFAVFIALGVFGVLRSGVVRPFALKLTGREFALSLLLYAVAIALCCATLWAVTALLGYGSDPLALIRSLVNF